LAESGGQVLVRQAASLSELDRTVRKRCGDDEVWYELHSGDAKLDHLLRTIRATRLAVRLTNQQVRAWTREALSSPRMIPLSARDAGIALGVSFQRVQQIRQAKGFGDAYRGAPPPDEDTNADAAPE
jgi:hypothetical protein